MSATDKLDSQLAAEIHLLSELPLGLRDRCFEPFRRLYQAAFPLPDEQQDAEEWRRPPRDGGPRSLVILAGRGLASSEAPDVWGGIVAGYYPESRCALLAYLVVDEAWRGLGVARQLVDEAVDRLEEEAESDGVQLRAVFAEAEDFRRDEIAEKGEHPRRRLAILDRLSARWIDVPYVMPRLDATKKRDPNLLLLALPHSRVTLDPTTVPLGAVEDFLKEYYAPEPTNPADPLRDDALARTIGALEQSSEDYYRSCQRHLPSKRSERRVPLKALPRPADPWLKLREVGVCVHVRTVDVMNVWSEQEERQFLETRYGTADLGTRIGRTRLKDGQSLGRQPYACPIYHSFELDVLSYRFHSDPPIESSVVPGSHRRLRICFPEEIVYVAEGFEHCIVDVVRHLDARVSLSSSSFRESGVRIWHLAFRPELGEFSELDIIRLISLYYRGQEQTDRARHTDFLTETRFKLEGADAELSFSQLLTELSSEGPGRLAAEEPSAATIELDPFCSGQQASEEWVSILSAFGLPAERENDAPPLEEIYKQREVKKLLDACCGVISGLFDYKRMSFSEMRETLKKDVSTHLYWLSRATLTKIDTQEQCLPHCIQTVGVSPYLIVPHAVLLHNELVVDQIERVARFALDQSAARVAAGAQRIAELRRARLQIKRLDRGFVPNVFQYSTDRELYEVGSERRGAREKKEVCKRLLEEIEAHLRESQAKRERVGEFLLTALGVAFGATAYLEVVDFFADSTRVAQFWPATGWTLGLAGLGVVSVVVLMRAWPRR